MGQFSDGFGWGGGKGFSHPTSSGRASCAVVPAAIASNPNRMFYSNCSIGGIAGASITSYSNPIYVKNNTRNNLNATGRNAVFQDNTLTTPAYTSAATVNYGGGLQTMRIPSKGVPNSGDGSSAGLAPGTIYTYIYAPNGTYGGAATVPVYTQLDGSPIVMTGSSRACINC
jgi:hypothetical protein